MFLAGFLMWKKMPFIIVVSLAMVLVGCVNQGPKQTGGALVGGGLGALAGSQFGKGKGQIVATGVGAILGALLGGYAGQQMDQADERLAANNANRTLNYAPDGVTQTWRNPNTGYYGRSFVNNSQGSCRVLNTYAYDRYGNVIGNESATYCQDAYGNWRPAY